jgi:type I restriction enzyme S subunit
MKTIVPEGYKKTKFGYIPNEWKIDNFSKVIKPIVREVEKPNEPYWRLGLRSHGKGTFHELVEDPNTVSMDKLYVVKEDDLIVNITFAWEHAVALADKNDEDKLVSHRFPTYQFTNNNVPLFYKYYVLQTRFKYELENISPGGAGRNRVMSKTDFLKIDVLIPPNKEQTKIAQILTTWDKVIVKQEKLIKEKEQLKKGLMQKLLSGEVRFDGFDNEWEEVKLGDITDIKTGSKDLQDKKDNGEYPFFVRSKNIERIDTYSYNGEAILIPGDGQIGQVYHYVNCKFDYHQRVYKISDSKESILKFIYYVLQKYFYKHAMSFSAKATVDSLRLPIIKSFKIFLPSIVEQQKIAEVLSLADDEINLLKNKLEELKLQKKALMQKLLTGEVRVKV